MIDQEIKDIHNKIEANYKELAARDTEIDKRVAGMVAHGEMILKAVTENSVHINTVSRDVTQLTIMHNKVLSKTEMFMGLADETNEHVLKNSRSIDGINKKVKPLLNGHKASSEQKKDWKTFLIGTAIMVVAAVIIALLTWLGGLMLNAYLAA